MCPRMNYLAKTYDEYVCRRPSLVLSKQKRVKWCSLFKEWILDVHSKFTLISLFSKIHSLKSEHIYSFLFREYMSTTPI